MVAGAAGGWGLGWVADAGLAGAASAACAVFGGGAGVFAGVAAGSGVSALWNESAAARHVAYGVCDDLCGGGDVVCVSGGGLFCGNGRGGIGAGVVESAGCGGTGDVGAALRDGCAGAGDAGVSAGTSLDAGREDAGCAVSENGHAAGVAGADVGLDECGGACAGRAGVF